MEEIDMKMMKGSPLAITVILFSLLCTTECFSQETPPPPDNGDTGCIQGIVTYRNPQESSPIPCVAATVSLTIPGKDRPFIDTQTDKQGRYCLNVPLRHGRVDLKVWGLNYMDKENSICQGEKTGIDLGSMPRKCGEGCMRIDVEVACKEGYLRRRR